MTWAVKRARVQMHFLSDAVNTLSHLCWSSLTSSFPPPHTTSPFFSRLMLVLPAAYGSKFRLPLLNMYTLPINNEAALALVSTVFYLAAREERLRC
jgi:hypothetical protein